MAKSEDIKKLEENWELLKKEEGEREKQEFMDSQQKKSEKSKTKSTETGEPKPKDAERQKKEFMDLKQQQEKNRRKE